MLLTVRQFLKTFSSFFVGASLFARSRSEVDGVRALNCSERGGIPEKLSNLIHDWGTGLLFDGSQWYALCKRCGIRAYNWSIPESGGIVVGRPILQSANAVKLQPTLDSPEEHQKQEPEKAV